VNRACGSEEMRGRSAFSFVEFDVERLARRRPSACQIHAFESPLSTFTAEFSLNWYFWKALAQDPIDDKKSAPHFSAERFCVAQTMRY
jgi:hypothetical protein